MKLETSSNSTRERIPRFGYGEDYRDHPEIYKNNNSVFSDPVVNITPKSEEVRNFSILKIMAEGSQLELDKKNSI
ncbi:hypothetical protein LHK12_20860 [Providencia rettgeri]|nr:hypothetical protein [Providencia rettgeri]